jgi:phosphatidylethanolamine-binding protein (PEBP) family uncharacterized protein
MRRFTPSMLVPSLGLAALLFAACSSGSDETGTGGSAGSQTGHGGTTGSAGSPGNGGSSGPAGAPGHGGSSGPAGTTGTAGSAAGTTGTAGGTAGSTAGTTGAAGLANNGEGGAVGGHTGGSGGKAGGGAAGSGAAGTTGGAGSSGGAFTLTSPNQADGAKFDGKYTCNGGALMTGVNPELDWAGVPAGTKSFAITFIDTTIGADKSMGQHWAIWNIPWDAATGKVAKFPEMTKTLSGDLANAKQSSAFFAPCAQSLMNNMDDNYEFTIYALSADLTFTGTSVANCLNALKMVTPLGTATLHGHAGLKGK